MIRLLKKLASVSFFKAKSGSAAVSVTPDTPTDDELRVAYEWVTPNSRLFAIMVRTSTSPDGWALCPRPKCVDATLRKLGAQ